MLKDSPCPEALCSVAAYIDLNPMRAGICKNPGNYAWSGYGQAENSEEVLAVFAKTIAEIKGVE
ncbi:MAG: hypothetical protein JJU05_12795 [Verrucomicrobia bacterium]|nr:hypothetical protein [Verrucomicrobiota bacterium]MCH8529147.1 hypothetical protein [Kiritimatiellia bacterium]